jgi:Skp family chaperone for outer membrane proteins
MAAFSAAGPAPAQYAAPPAPILVVDLDRALRDSAAGEAMRQSELRERDALQARFDATREALEAEETEMARIRASTPAVEFERRVVAFDRRVRAARREAQEAGAALQARYAAAQRALLEGAQPLLQQLMQERSAVIVLDKAQVLMSLDALNVTELLTQRLDAAHPDATALLAPAPPAPRPPASGAGSP